MSATIATFLASLVVLEQQNQLVAIFAVLARVWPLATKCARCGMDKDVVQALVVLCPRLLYSPLNKHVPLRRWIMQP